MKTSFRSILVVLILLTPTIMSFDALSQTNPGLVAPSNLRFLADGEDPDEKPMNGVKWYPGHYVFLGSRNSGSFLEENQDSLIASYKDYASFPIVRGSQIRYIWRELEPTKGVYRFDKIIADADFLAQRGKYLIVQVQHKSYSPSQYVVPADMESAAYDGGQFQIGGSTAGGWMIKSWLPQVQERHRVFLKALAEAVDGHPAVVLVNINESAVAPPPDMLNWTAKQDATRDYLVTLGTYLRSIFVSTPTVSYANFPSEWLPAFEKSALSSGNGHGGPDTVPYAWDAGLGIAATYETAKRLSGDVPIIYSVQWTNYLYERAAQAGDPVPVADLYKLNSQVVKSNFVTWLKRDPYWADVKNLWSQLQAQSPGDPSGGLRTDCPRVIGYCRN